MVYSLLVVGVEGVLFGREGGGLEGGGEVVFGLGRGGEVGVFAFVDGVEEVEVVFVFGLLS